MKTIFFDNQMFIYAFEKGNADALNLIINRLTSGKYRLVASLETLIEFSQSEKLEHAQTLSQAIERFNPAWIQDFVTIQSSEVQNYIAMQFEGWHKSTINPTTNDFRSLFDSNYTDISPQAFIVATNAKVERDANMIAHQRHSNILATLRDAEHSNLFTEEMNKAALQSIIQDRLIRSEFRDKLSAEDIQHFTEYCIKNKNRFFKACPSMNAERWLTKYRASNHKRVPRKSDSKDLTISIAAFPYVSVFCTADKFLSDGLRYVRKHTKSIETEVLEWPKLNKNQ